MKTSICMMLAFCASLQAGQSLANGTATNVNVAARPKSQPIRIEFFVHDWTSPVDGSRVFEAAAYGVIGLYSSTNLRILPLGDGDVVADIPLGLFTSKRMYVRLQRDPDAKTWLIEAWDDAGIRQSNNTINARETTGNTAGTFVRAAASSGAVAFFRVHSTLVGSNSRPPVTFDTASRLLEWKFDGNLSDSGGSQYTATGGVTYVSTPGQIAVSVPQANSKSWNSWTSLRAGFPAQLDGNASFSQSDSDASVACSWKQLSGPTQVIIENADQCTATVSGLIFGSYKWELKVTSVDQLVAISELETGAVATDINGVVIHANPDVEKIFGPMIAFGRNPWGYADETHLRASTLRGKTRAADSPPTWAVPQPGTVTYDTKTLVSKARTAVAMTTTSTTITVDSVANLDLTQFPTIIGVGGFPSYSDEEILICGASGTTLTVCLNGRGYVDQSRISAWAVNTAVYQRKVTGNGTNFLTRFCPGGPGLPGVVAYSQGSVNLTTGSNIMTGLNTNWTTAGGVFTGVTVRVEAIANGNPFVFQALVASVQSPTQVTLDRVFPAVAASGAYSYKVLGAFPGFAPRYKRTDGTESQLYAGVSACLSDTELYWRFGFEVQANNLVHTDMTWSYTDSVWVNNNGNAINYYDEVLADYSLYFRSGWGPALTNARLLGDYWLKSPFIDEGYLDFAPRNASLTGPVAAAVLDGRTDNWPAIRRFAARGAARVNAPCADDMRETSYLFSWLALAAMFDPVDTGSFTEPNQRSYWKAKLDELYTRENNCKGDFSFPTPAFSTSTPMTVINGSTAVTGTGFTATMCQRTASGTALLQNGASTLSNISPLLPPGQAYVFLSGLKQGLPYSIKVEIRGNGSVANLGTLWQGDSGTVFWQTESDSSNMTISPNNFSDPSFGKAYACRYNSPTSLTLDRGYEGPTGTAYFVRSNLVGYGTQPFFLGIKAFALRYASYGAKAGTDTNFLNLATGVANWIRDKGFDPSNGGMYYGRGFTNCEPPATAASTEFVFRNSECGYGVGKVGKGVARPLLAEAQNAMRILYESDPSQSNLEIGDTFYANQWGRPAFTDPRVALWEGDVFNEFSTNQSLNTGKWYGFQFGIGMAHQWPAVRQGGVRPPEMQETSVMTSFEGIEGAVSVQMTVTRPSGEVISGTCTDTTCTFNFDKRQGAHWYVLEFFDVNGVKVSRSEPALLDPQ